VSGNDNYDWAMNQDLSSDSWTKFEVSQYQLSDKKVMYQIKQDGNVMVNVENTTPTTFYQMELWAADPFHGQRSNLSMKNLKYEIFQTCKVLNFII
jgi:hypothetical protein